MPKKKRSPSSKRKAFAKRGMSKKSKRAPSKKNRTKSAKRSASKTTGGSSISTVTKKKKKWTDMQIFRVPLDPSQAVLSCCDASSRAQYQIGTQWNAYNCGTAPSEAPDVAAS